MATTRIMSIGDFLLRRIREAGVDEIFGVPGDFSLELVQQVEDEDLVTWIGTCNELNASYAADGYARMTGLAALIVTHGVGALSAINGVAGSYSEHVPVVCVRIVAAPVDRTRPHDAPHPRRSKPQPFPAGVL